MWSWKQPATALRARKNKRMGKKIKINKHQSDPVLERDRVEGVFDFNMHISGK